MDGQGISIRKDFVDLHQLAVNIRIKQFPNTGFSREVPWAFGGLCAAIHGVKVEETRLNRILL